MGKGSRISEFFTSFDIYGHPIGVHYKGSDTFQTRMGALCTLITYVLMTVNFISLVKAFQDGSKQEEKVSTTYVDKFFTEAYNFKENNFDIALMTYPPLDASLGTFVFSHEREG